MRPERTRWEPSSTATSERLGTTKSRTRVSTVSSAQKGKEAYGSELTCRWQWQARWEEGLEPRKPSTTSKTLLKAPCPNMFFWNKPGTRAADYINKEEAVRTGLNNKQQTVGLGHQRADIIQLNSPVGLKHQHDTTLIADTVPKQHRQRQPHTRAHKTAKGHRCQVKGN
jgi:hypothetical protein